MSGIKIVSHGSFDKAAAYLNRLKMFKLDRILNNAGNQGVEALKAASPKDTGEMANSWTYTIINDSNSAKIEWHNTDIEGGYSVALLVQYGHGTNNGGYVVPRDYINPAMEPIFEEISRKVGEEVKRL